MEAYTTLVSLMHIIDQIQNHPRPPISLDKKQIESLTEKVTFLQDFLESYSINGGSKDADALESRIADAAYAAEDIIESHVLDQILAGSTSRGEKISSIYFYQRLEKVIQDLDLIKREVIPKIKEKTGVQLDQLPRSSISAGSLKSLSTGHNTTVGLDDVKLEIMDKLTGQQCHCQIIPIVGMGGIGKTTLARNIYLDPLVKHHFDILAWATISQECDVKEILVEILLCLGSKWSRESLNGMIEGELGVELHKSLVGRRYLIVMDDIWSIEAWGTMKFFFPDNNNRSRIIITTRLSNLAFQLSSSCGLKMNFLDENKSWDLLRKNVFGEEDCPIELEGIGKKIAKNCKGLPLSIVVIGGLLAKSRRTREYWQHVAENLNLIVNLEDNERCLTILRMSYNQLPIHLKPCFLNMGVFPEDVAVPVSGLIKLWVAQGFLKPACRKSLEVVAEEYLNDLIDRNLILVHRWGYGGKIKSCKLHDLLRDVCLREAHKEKSPYVKRPHDNSQCEPPTPSLIFNNPRVIPYIHFPKDKFLLHCRYLAILNKPEPCFRLLFPICHLWNLQTLIFWGTSVATAPSEIWKMPQLRHVQFGKLELPDPPSGHMGREDDFALGNLQTLSKIYNSKFSEGVVKKIPNIMKLQICYEGFEEWSSCGVNNLDSLHKLESLACFFDRNNKPSRRSYLAQNLNFPKSLTKLTLEGTGLHWEDMTTKIGSLPLLQVLKLKTESFKGPEWETAEGQFCSLKFLLIDGCVDLECWITDSSHFPRLEHLCLLYLRNLEEIPLGIGEILTLQSIQLDYCSKAAAISVKRILEEHEEHGYEGLRVQVLAQPWRSWVRHNS